MVSKKFSLALGAFLCSLSVVNAQTDIGITTEVVGQAEIKTKEDAEKISESPELDKVDVEKQPVSYSILKTRDVESNYKVEAPKAPSLKINTKPGKLLKHQIGLGYGIDNDLWGEYIVNGGRSRSSNWTAKASHFSSSGTTETKGDIPYQNTSAMFSYKKFTKHHSIRVIPRYTYYKHNILKLDLPDSVAVDAEAANDTLTNQLKNQFHQAGVTASLKSHYKDSNRINYDITLDYDYLVNKAQKQENLVALNYKLNRFLQNDIVNLKGNLIYQGDQQLADSTYGVIFSASPSIFRDFGNFDLEVGFNIHLLTDDKQAIKAMPLINMDFTLLDEMLLIFAEITSDAHRNPYIEQYQYNPLITNIPHQFTFNQVNINAGLRGLIGTHSSFTAGVKYRRAGNEVLFVQDTSYNYTNRFTAVVDTFTHLAVYGQATYNDNILDISLSGQFNGYSTLNETFAWYRPLYEANLYAKYNFQNKIHVYTDMFLVGTRKVKNMDTEGNATHSELPAYLDMNLGIEYKYSNFLRLFISANNLFNSDYERWQGYPSQGIHGIFGFKANF